MGFLEQEAARVFFPKPPGCSALWVTIWWRRLTQLVQPGEKHRNKCKHGDSRNTFKNQTSTVTWSAEAIFQLKPTRCDSALVQNVSATIAAQMYLSISLKGSKGPPVRPKAYMSQPNDRGRTFHPSRKLLSNGAICRAVQTLERLVCQHFYRY